MEEFENEETREIAKQLNEGNQVEIIREPKRQNIQVINDEENEELTPEDSEEAEG